MAWTSKEILCGCCEEVEGIQEEKAVTTTNKQNANLTIHVLSEAKQSVDDLNLEFIEG